MANKKVKQYFGEETKAARAEKAAPTKRKYTRRKHAGRPLKEGDEQMVEIMVPARIAYSIGLAVGRL